MRKMRAKALLQVANRSLRARSKTQRGKSPDPSKKLHSLPSAVCTDCSRMNKASCLKDLQHLQPGRLGFQIRFRFSRHNTGAGTICCLKRSKFIQFAEKVSKILDLIMAPSKFHLTGFIKIKNDDAEVTMNNQIARSASMKGLVDFSF